MSAASSANSQVRHSTPVTARDQDPQRVARPAARSAPMYASQSSEVDNEIKLHLNDIPREPTTLDVEGLRPSLLSRLLDLVAPGKR